MKNTLYQIMLISHGIKDFYNSEMSLIRYYRAYDENETIDICIFSQSLMGYNWKDYINEAFRVLRYNGEIIISESSDRYDLIKKYINELGYHIKKEEFEKTNRWFYLWILNDKC